MSEPLEAPDTLPGQSLPHDADFDNLYRAHNELLRYFYAAIERINELTEIVERQRAILARYEALEAYLIETDIRVKNKRALHGMSDLELQRALHEALGGSDE